MADSFNFFQTFILFIYLFVDTGLNHLIETKRVWKESTLSAGAGGRGEVPAEPEIPWRGLPSK